MACAWRNLIFSLQNNRAQVPDPDCSIILDSGSHLVRAGLSTDAAPRHVVRTSAYFGTGNGPDSWDKHGAYNTDWDAVAELWDDLFTRQMRVDTSCV